MELLTAYYDDAIDPTTRDAVRAHLSCCADCRGYEAQFRATVRALGDQPAEPPPAAMRTRLLAAFRERRAGRLADS
ncbi:anti-sigma factor family protein [Nonomuraea maritima]|uniref:anti-sigma factor family protein n=1 Tax=Nonomuraea maritima TaxID=683260 RepID=UPI0037111AA7